MKTVVIGEPSGVSMETILAVYPRHKAVVGRDADTLRTCSSGPFAPAAAESPPPNIAGPIAPQRPNVAYVAAGWHLVPSWTFRPVAPRVRGEAVVDALWISHA